MTATPTPGDLSARLLPLAELLNRDSATFLRGAGREHASNIRAAIAALSALPAAGGAKPRPVAWYVFAGTEHWVTHDEDEAEGNRAGGCEVRPLIFGDTTPQPSAAEGEGEPALPWRGINECPDSDDLFWFMRGDTIDGPRPPAPDDADYWDWFAPCEAPSFAAPAAGKGVDDASREDS